MDEDSQTYGADDHEIDIAVRSLFAKSDGAKNECNSDIRNFFQSRTQNVSKTAGLQNEIADVWEKRVIAIRRVEAAVPVRALLDDANAD